MIYGEKLTTHKGKVYDFLGIDLDYSEKGAVKVFMIKYQKKVIKEFHHEIKGTSAIPAAVHLFQVKDEEAKFLPKEQAAIFHHTVSQLLFMCTQARHNIQMVVAFLITRVKKPEEDA